MNHHDVNRNNYVGVNPVGPDAGVLPERGRRRSNFTVCRLVAVLVALFALALLGLELSLNIQRIEDGPAYLFERPPPVYFYNTTSD